uniref:AlNc14C30G2812 protein n=1 Tax=Albugo laibachii Nc14 TaxID=890382 RepID=F0W7K6_9STRA|nr:AlNc14C30G2812 [Albugo laibachii Nc14]|eukprot:CCA17107.1 AlNc14C30G2812 [Albugo laibachii Nc14]
MPTYESKDPIRCRKSSQKHDAQFALLLGNTFHDGVESVDDPQWECVWAKRFEVEKLDIPFFAVNGNREKMKNNTATGCYGEYGKHWILPDMAYSVNVMNAAGDFMMIFTDTEVETKEIKSGESDSGNAEQTYFESLKENEIQSIFKPGKGTSSEPHLREYTAPDVTWMAGEQKWYEKWKHPKTSLIIMVGHRYLKRPWRLIPKCM